MGEGMQELVFAWSRAYRKGPQWKRKDSRLRAILPGVSMAHKWLVLVVTARSVGTHRGR